MVNMYGVELSLVQFAIHICEKHVQNIYKNFHLNEVKVSSHTNFVIKFTENMFAELIIIPTFASDCKTDDRPMPKDR